MQPAQQGQRSVVPQQPEEYVGSHSSRRTHHHAKVLKQAVGPGPRRAAVLAAAAAALGVRLRVAPRPLPLLADVLFGVEEGPLRGALALRRQQRGQQQRVQEGTVGWRADGGLPGAQSSGQRSQRSSPCIALTPRADSGAAAVCSSALALLMSLPSSRRPPPPPKPPSVDRRLPWLLPSSLPPPLNSRMRLVLLLATP